MQPPKRTHTPPTRSRTTLTLRTRSRIRLFLLLTSIFILLAVVNELRCLKFGCSERFRLHIPGRTAATSTNGPDGAHITPNGAAVLPDDWKFRVGEQLQMGQLGLGDPNSKGKEKDKGTEKNTPKKAGLASGSLMPPSRMNAPGNALAALQKLREQSVKEQAAKAAAAGAESRFLPAAAEPSASSPASSKDGKKGKDNHQPDPASLRAQASTYISSTAVQAPSPKEREKAAEAGAIDYFGAAIAEVVNAKAKAQAGGDEDPLVGAEGMVGLLNDHSAHRWHSAAKKEKEKEKQKGKGKEEKESKTATATEKTAAAASKTEKAKAEGKKGAKGEKWPTFSPEAAASTAASSPSVSSAPQKQQQAPAKAAAPAPAPAPAQPQQQAAAKVVGHPHAPPPAAAAAPAAVAAAPQQAQQQQAPQPDKANFAAMDMGMMMAAGGT